MNLANFKTNKIVGKFNKYFFFFFQKNKYKIKLRQKCLNKIKTNKYNLSFTIETRLQCFVGLDMEKHSHAQFPNCNGLPLDQRTIAKIQLIIVEQCRL